VPLANHRTSRDASNINTATEQELSRLAALTDDDADRIVASRPYAGSSGRT